MKKLLFISILGLLSASLYGCDEETDPANPIIKIKIESIELLKFPTGNWDPGNDKPDVYPVILDGQTIVYKSSLYWGEAENQYTPFIFDLPNNLTVELSDKEYTLQLWDFDGTAPDEDDLIVAMKFNPYNNGLPETITFDNGNFAVKITVTYSE